MMNAFQEYIAANNIDIKILKFDDSTKTSHDAANVLKCELGQIAKSIIMKTDNNEPILIITSGVNRVDTKKVEKLLNQSVSKPDASFVKENTGYTIGGVPPFAHISPITTFIDEDLLKYPVIYSAAGDQNSLFKTSVDQILSITDATVADVKE